MTLSSLAGRRVLELGGYLAAPFACNVLQGLGADVIKVESMTGDPTRTAVRGGPGGIFIAYSHGKRSLCIDLASAAGHEVFRRLLTTADIVVHDLSPASTRKLKVTEEDCLRENPHLIYCHIKGYGPGPRADDVASNPIVEAATGVMFGNQVNGRPTRLGPSYHDMFAGFNAVVGILSELISRADGKSGAALEIGLYETALHVAARDLVTVGLDLQAEKGTTTHGEYAHPGYGAYETADGRWLYLLLLSDNHWAKFCSALQLPEAADPSLATRSQRQSRGAQVEAVVNRAIRLFAFAEMATRLNAAAVGFTEVKRPAEVLDDVQAREEGKLVDVRYLGHEYQVPAFPINAKSSASKRSDPPLLAQHTREILASLGYSAAEYATLIAQRAIPDTACPIRHS